MKTILLLCLGAMAACSTPTRAQSNDVSLVQLNHRWYSTIDGAPADITTIAQTPDGTLWVGGRAGLARFDGLKFIDYPGLSEAPLPGTNIATLLATRDGGLWIGFRPGGAAFLARGRVTRYGVENGLPDGSIEQFAFDGEGNLWAATRRGLARFTGTRWEHGANEVETPYAFLLDRNGTFWVGALNGLFARVAGESKFRAIDRTLEFGTGGTALVEAPDGRIYAAPHFKLVRVDQPRDPRPGGTVTL